MVANPCSHTLLFLRISGSQAKMFYASYPKNRTDLYIIHEENDVLETGELVNVKETLKQGKHTCLIMRMEYPRAYKIH